MQEKTLNANANCNANSPDSYIDVGQLGSIGKERGSRSGMAERDIDANKDRGKND